VTGLQVEALTKTFGSGPSAVEAVRDATFTVRPGEFAALVGPSGSGKSTLLAMIGALLEPSSGRIYMDGEDVGALSRGRRSRYRRSSVGFVFQANNLVPYLTARENLLIMGAIGAMPPAAAGERADQLLEELGVAGRAGARATELSGGERQRIAIGRALMARPRLLLIDEPTASLDSKRGKEIVDLIGAEIRGQGVVGLMVTHDMDIAARADRILEIHDGVVREGSAPVGPAQEDAAVDR
jgi:putative ABC transport system ATP-binding protein